MAYFGGTVSQRPWPRLDVRFVLLLILSVAGLVAAGWMVRESIIAHLEETRAATDQAATVKPNEVSPGAIAVVPQKAAPTSIKTTEVLVAIDAIAAGTRLSPVMFRLETKEAEGNLQERALLNLDQIEGAYLRIGLAAGSPLLKDIISTTNPLNTTAAITERIPPGYRAVAIPVNVVTGVEGWVQPGVRVDVIWTTDNRGKLVTTTLIENAQVLSAERRLETEHGKVNAEGAEPAVPVPNHVTLLVTTRDSQKLQLAKNSGSLSLSLRGNDDVDPGNAATLSTDSIIKNRSQSVPHDFQGKVSFDGKEFVLRGSDLLPSNQVNKNEKAKEAGQ